MAIVCIIQYEVKLVFDIYSIFSLAKKKPAVVRKL